MNDILPDLACPSRIASRVRRIKPSASTAAADRANSLRRAGRSIVSLVVGKPNFDTPAPIRAAATAAMDQGATRYTLMAGTTELRQAIAAKLLRDNGLTYGLDEIIATNGAKSAMYTAFAVTLEAGDEVIINCGGLIGRRMPGGGVLEDDGAVVMYLLEHAGVALVAGTAYGLSAYLRLSIATSLEVLQEGCAPHRRCRRRASITASRPGGTFNRSSSNEHCRLPRSC